MVDTPGRPPSDRDRADSEDGGWGSPVPAEYGSLWSAGPARPAPHDDWADPAARPSGSDRDGSPNRGPAPSPSGRDGSGRDGFPSRGANPGGSGRPAAGRSAPVPAEPPRRPVSSWRSRLQGDGRAASAGSELPAFAPLAGAEAPLAGADGMMAVPLPGSVTNERSRPRRAEPRPRLAPEPAFPPAGGLPGGPSMADTMAVPVTRGPRRRPYPAADIESNGLGPDTDPRNPDLRGGGPDVVLTDRRRRARPTRVRSRATIRHLDLLTVIRVSLMFWLVMLAAVVVAAILLYEAANVFGSLPSIEKSIRTLFSLKSFRLHPTVIAEYTGLVGGVIALVGMVGSVVFALIYNLIADVVGGVRVELETLRPE